MEIPFISSEWQRLFKPEKNGNYVNDHSIFYGFDNELHLIGITGFGKNPYEERYFVHAAAQPGEQLAELGRACDTGSLAWAPCVIRHEDSYYMFYGPSPTRLAVSPDAGEWFGYEVKLFGQPPMACHRDHFILKIADKRWLMYASGIHNKKSSICCMESDNLLEWHFRGFALTSGEASEINPPWGGFESPFVVKRKGLYYLFTTYTDCSRENYHNTLVFCSPSAYSFGLFDADNAAVPIARLYTHAPEIFSLKGDEYISSCGWRDMAFTGGEVQYARLEWREAE